MILGMRFPHDVAGGSKPKQELHHVLVGVRVWFYIRRRVLLDKIRIIDLATCDLPAIGRLFCCPPATFLPAPCARLEPRLSRSRFDIFFYVVFFQILERIPLVHEPLPNKRRPGHKVQVPQIQCPLLSLRLGFINSQRAQQAYVHLIDKPIRPLRHHGLHESLEGKRQQFQLPGERPQHQVRRYEVPHQVNRNLDLADRHHLISLGLAVAWCLVHVPVHITIPKIVSSHRALLLRVVDVLRASTRTRNPRYTAFPALSWPFQAPVGLPDVPRFIIRLTLAFRVYRRRIRPSSVISAARPIRVHIIGVHVLPPARTLRAESRCGMDRRFRMPRFSRRSLPDAGGMHHPRLLASHDKLVI